MNANRLQAMRAVAWNLKLEGQQSRSDCVTELCDEIERANECLKKVVSAIEWHEGKRPHNLSTIGRAYWLARKLLCYESDWDIK